MDRIKAAKQYINKSKLLGREEFTIDIESEDKIKLLKYKVPSERMDESIVKVTIPDFITHIGDKAFSRVSKGLKVIYKGDSLVDINSMFNNYMGLYIDLSEFNTHKVTSMRNMFHNCRSLKELSISNFDVKDIRAKNGMFNCCRLLDSKIEIKGGSII